MKTLMIIFLLISIMVYGQTQFQKKIGGSTADNAFCLIQASDGGYVIAGNSQSYTWPSDVYVVKFNSQGHLVWTRNVGGTGWEFGYYITQTTDGGYAIAGTTNSFGAGETDIYIVKLDSAGNFKWNKTIGGTGIDFPGSIIQTTDGGLCICGATSSFGLSTRDIIVFKLNSGGTLLWLKTFGGTGLEAGSGILQTMNGGFAITGSSSTNSAGLTDMLTVLLDSTGSLIWSRTTGGSNYDGGTAIIQCPDSSFIQAGYTRSFGAGSSDGYLVKYSPVGSLIWTKTFGTAAYEDFSDIKPFSDGGFVLGGFIDIGPNYGLIIKLNSIGNLQWVKNTLNDILSIAPTSDGGCAASGSIDSSGSGNSDLCLIKFDAGWNTCGNISATTFNVGSGGTISSPVFLVNSPTPIVTTPVPTTGTGGILTSMCGVTGVQQETTGLPKEFSLSQNYPNPFNPATKINYSIPKQGLVMLKVYDIFGREVKTLVKGVLTSGDYTVELEGSNLSSGIYFYKLKSEDFSETKRMVLIK